ncbi:hypothetical protein Trydic_g23830 [Trypoxylus dichotomus]
MADIDVHIRQRSVTELMSAPLADWPLTSRNIQQVADIIADIVLYSLAQWRQYDDDHSATGVFEGLCKDAKNVIMVDFVEQGFVTYSTQYCTTLKKLKAHHQQVRPTKAVADVLLLYDNARPHTTEEIVRIGWKALPHPPCNPDLAS